VVLPRIRTLGLSGNSRLAIHAVRDWIVRSALAEVYVTETAAVFRRSMLPSCAARTAVVVPAPLVPKSLEDLVASRRE
jgi:hypothetical protein